MSAGLLTVALAVAAHGVASGALPMGTVTVQLAVLAATVGAVASAMPRADDTRVLLSLLAMGQLLGHRILDAHMHHHASATAPPPEAMLAAHVVAVAAGAVLIAVSGRLCNAVSRAARTAVQVSRPHPLVFTAPAGAIVSADQPLRSALLLAASVSHRGPPVSYAR